ncbi:MAG TPA: glycogen synthase GlgA [Patescibacteria group bacterium]|nr:glycogen synthase GlgA [Patescibacteria group bacterium]
MTQVLIVASEAKPFIKTGGLGDVIGSLPKALVGLGVDARVILPKYNDIPETFKEQMKEIGSLTIAVGWRQQYCGLQQMDYDGVRWYFIDNEYYFSKRPGVYGYYDDAERFAFFCRAVLEALPHLNFSPEIIHCHDWQTAPLVPLLKSRQREESGKSRIRTIYTIHNLSYQGVFPPEVFGNLLGLEESYFTADGMEFFGQVNYAKGGLAYADVLTTVSETYAEEIQTSYFGEHLEGLLRTRTEDLHGIVNGIDYHDYNPMTDKEVFVNYDVASLENRRLNKEKLQELLDLPVKPEIPMIGIVSNLINAKGFDLIAHILDDILATDVQMVVLGTGELRYQELFRYAAQRYPLQVSANILFSDSLARKIYAGADLYLMPARFEPCGIGQLIALRYGCLPLVREVGGLRDTVRAYETETGEGNGFTVANYNAHDLLHVIQEAFQLYRNGAEWKKIIKNAMTSDYSWNNSARKYQQIYQDLLEKA